MQVRTRRVTAASGMEIVSDSPSRAIAEFWGRKGSGGSGLSLRFDRRYPDNEQRIATPVCVEKWPEANERDPAYHRKAETIPRGGGSFFIECSGACHLSGHDTLEECKAHLSETYFHLDRVVEARCVPLP